MAGVFLSYDHDDAAKARAIAHALEKAGHSVWWDLHVRGGTEYSKVIEQALNASDVVVVLWTAQSVESAWVRDEAAIGRDRGCLVPITLDGTQPPLGFRQYQTIDFSRWIGRGKPPEIQTVAEAINSLPTGHPPTANAKPAGRASDRGHDGAKQWQNPWLLLVVVVVVIALLIARPWEEKASVPVVAVKAVDASPDAQALARDLVAKLTMLQSSGAVFMRLVDDRDGGEHDANLLFRIGGEITSPKPHANLVLVSGKDGSILWSRDFDGSGGAADIGQQTAFIAARVLGCALEGLSAKSGELQQSVLKLYLNACALLDESFFHDLSQAISILQRVTKEAPGFVPGWSKLLVAETTHYQGLNVAGQREAGRRLRQVMADARKADPEIPEAYVAEVEFLPGGAFTEQVRLNDLALKIAPDNLFALTSRSITMLGVGRMDAAVEDARKAARLDPISPAMRSSYIQTLIYSGQADAARAELQDAEQIWPGATTIIDARFKLGLYGTIVEAEHAQQLLRNGKIRTSFVREAFLRARIDPAVQNINEAVDVASSAFRARSDIDTTRALIYVLGEADRTDQLLGLLLTWKDAPQIPYFIELLFRPPQADLRADPRFMQVAARLGLLEYWQRSGDWPDFCSDPDLPYDCKMEAARIAK